MIWPHLLSFAYQNPAKFTEPLAAINCAQAVVDSRLPILLSEAQQLSMGSDLAIQYFTSFGCIRYFL